MLVIVAILFLHVLLLGLLLLGARGARALGALGAGYGLAILVLIAVQTGHLSGPPPAAALPPPSSLPSVSNGRCREIVTLLVENRIILQQPGGTQLVVARAGWQQLPEEVREQIVSCVEQLFPDRATGRPIEVIER